MLSGPKMDRDRCNRTRERSDKISSLMGQYLLRGYRMLGSCCEHCDTVLLKFRDEPEYCIGCEEVDVILNGNQQAAQPTIEPPKQTPRIPVEREIPTHQEAPQLPEDVAMKSETLTTAINNLHEKIQWASSALGSCTSIEESIRYCELLKSCAEALKALREVDSVESNTMV